MKQSHQINFFPFAHSQVLIRHGHVFIDNPVTREQLSALHTRCHDIMCRRAASFIDQARSSPKMLTEAVKCVLQRTPDDLPWAQLQHSGWSTGSFEAVSKDGHLYSINTLDGTVLFDGSPPTRLPKEILTH